MVIGLTLSAARRVVRAAADCSTLSTQAVERSDVPFRCLVALGLVVVNRLSHGGRQPIRFAYVLGLLPFALYRVTVGYGLKRVAARAERLPTLRMLYLRVFGPSSRSRSCSTFSPHAGATLIHSAHQRNGRGPGPLPAGRAPVFSQRPVGQCLTSATAQISTVVYQDSISGPIRMGASESTIVLSQRH